MNQSFYFVIKFCQFTRCIIECRICFWPTVVSFSVLQLANKNVRSKRPDTFRRIHLGQSHLKIDRKSLILVRTVRMAKSRFFGQNSYFHNQARANVKSLNSGPAKILKPLVIQGLATGGFLTLTQVGKSGFFTKKVDFSSKIWIN